MKRKTTMRVGLAVVGVLGLATAMWMLRGGSIGTEDKSPSLLAERNAAKVVGSARDAALDQSRSAVVDKTAGDHSSLLPHRTDSTDSMDSTESTAGTRMTDAAARPAPATPPQAVPAMLDDEANAELGQVQDRYADCVVLDEKIGPTDAQGHYERVRVVRTDMKYPLVRVVEKRVISGRLSVISGGGRVIGDPAVAKAVADRQLSGIGGGKRSNEDEHRTLNIEHPTQKEGASPASMFDVGRSMLDVPSSDSTLLSQIAMVADHVTLQVKDGTSEAELAAFAQANGGSILRKLRVPGPGTYLVKLASVTVDTVPGAVAALGRVDGPVTLVEPDYIAYALETIPNDEYFESLWGIHNPGLYGGAGSVKAEGMVIAAEPMYYSPMTPANGTAGIMYDCGQGQPGEFPAGISGYIALIQRGGVTFADKAANAKVAGAVAAIIYNNEPGTFNGTLGAPGDWIPTVGVLSATEGAALLAMGRVMATVLIVPSSADIDAPTAWDLTTGSRSVLVGVIDTGIDYTHEDLAANMWNNPGETGVDTAGNDKRTNGIDDDGNGYVDDWHGWDFYNGDNDPMDDHMHGTHCAGTIGGMGNNGIGVAGVNWQVSLVGLKFISSGGSGYTADALEAVYYATGIGVKLTSNSWGGGGYEQSLHDAIADAGNHGILFVAAAGNAGSDNDVEPFYPCGYDLDNVISVAATDYGDNIASFSCYGATTVDLGAPGVGILSCQPGNRYQPLSGTSMACPHVAGACALLAAVAPDWTAAEIKAQVLANTDPLPALAGKCLTGGRLNIGKAAISPTPLARLAGSNISDAAPGGNGDGVCNPGETVKVSVQVRNCSMTPLTNVLLTATCTDAYVTVTDGAEAFGNLPALATAQAQDTFTLTLASNCPTPHEVTLGISMAADNGGPWTEQLRFTVYTSYQVSGSVRLNGAPVAGVTISYMGPMMGTRVTDANGAYLFGGIAGSYQVSARKVDWLSPGAKFVTVPPSTNGVDFAFTTATVSGRVTDGLTGQPVAGATISYGDALSGAVTSDGDGRYSFTRVYGQIAPLTVRVTHPAYFAAVTNVSVPPDALNVNFALGYSDIQADLTPIDVTATMGEVVTRTLNFSNQGLEDLTWSINPPGYERRAVNLNVTQPLAFDGDTLWSQGGYPYGLFTKFDPLSGAWLGSVRVPDACEGWNKYYWHGLDWDGANLWYTHADLSANPYLVIHAVSPASGATLKTLRPNISGVPGGMTVGDGNLWVLVRLTDQSKRVWKLDANTGAVLAQWPLPEEIQWPQGSYLSGGHKPHEIEYINGALYVASTPYDIDQPPPPEGSARLYKLNPDTGQILDSFSIPGIEVYGLARAGTRDLWLLALRVEGYQGWTDAHLIELGDEPWMRESPRSGTLAYRASQPVTLTLDTVPAGLGVHESVYRLASNDPDESDLEIPVRFTVLPNPSNHPPVIAEGAGVSVTMSEESAPTPFALTLHASDPDGDPLAWSVAAPAAHGSALALATGGTVAVEYRPATNYFGADSFLVQVADNKGGTAIIVVNVTVQNLNDPPTVGATVNVTLGPAPLTVNFSATATDPDGDTLTCLWNFGDGHTSYLTHPSHTYTNPGVYAVTVTVTDPGGLSGQTILTVGATDGTTRGLMYAWGQNAYGQLGNGTTDITPHPVPALVPGLFGIKTAIAGNGHTTVELADGNVYNWGQNMNGQLGDGTFTARFTPHPAPALAEGSVISAKGASTFVTGADGAVRGCGNNWYGLLGDGTTTDRSSPVPMSMADGTPVAGVKKFSSSLRHTLFVLEDGTTWGCGGNGYGALGVGTWDTEYVYPVQPKTKTGALLTGVKDVFAAQYYSLFLMNDGTVWTCGRNSYCCLGNGDTTSQSQNSPVQVIIENGTPLRGVVAVAGGYKHGVALKADGSVWSWGSNDRGALGDPSITVPRAYAVPSLISNVTAIAADGYFTLALKPDGSLWSWGGNATGEVGDGTTVNRLTPGLVTGLQRVTAISAGVSHCVALADARVNAVITDVQVVTVPEGGTAGFRVQLAEAPTNAVNVLVRRSSGDGDISVQSGSSLTFTPANWDQWQTVTLAAREEDDDPYAGSASFVCEAAGLNSAGVTASEVDNDTWLEVCAAPGGTTTPSDWVVVPKNMPLPISATPEAGSRFLKWAVIAGAPGATTFADANAATTTVTITAGEAGPYPGVPTTTIRADFTSVGNRAPVISTPAWAGPNPATLPNGTTIHVAAGDPDGDPLSYAWSRVSGPGAAGFGAAGAPNCGVSFGAAGTYVLRVTVDDNRGGTATSDVTLSVAAMTYNDPELRMTGFDRNAVPGELVIRWQSASNRWYTVQASSNLVHGFNLNLRTNIPATPPENVHTDNVSGVGCRFYRVTVE